MGFDSENAGKIVIDIETIGSPGARDFLDPVRAPSNYRDPAKIAAYCAEEFEKRVQTAALEADLCEVVAVGFMWDNVDATRAAVYTRADELSEAGLLDQMWYAIGNRAIVGFNILGYDLPVLIRRSQLLGIKYPSLNLDKYRSPHIDLLRRLTFNGELTYRTLGFYLRRFGIPHDDTTKGSDIAQMVAEGRWNDVASHCRADVEGTAALARRLGWLPVEQAEAVGF